MRAVELSIVLVLCVSWSHAVSIPPKIIEQSPVDIFYKDGESVKIKCKASGEPDPKYTWTRADKDFAPEGNEDRVVKLQDEGTIIINRPEDKDEGFYQCFASNSFGIAASQKFNLRQARLKNFNIAATTTIRPRLGEASKLKCPSPDSVPDADIYWAVGATPIEWDARMSVDYDDTLHFTHITQEDKKCFHCVASNIAMRKSVKGPLQCIEPIGRTASTGPLKMAWPQSRFDELGMVGQTKKLKCIYTANPTPTVLWSRKNGERFNNRVQTGNSGGQELVIQDLQFEDEGTYICSAFAAQSQTRMEMSISLKVESRPLWVSKPKDVTIGEGGSATFECSGQGVPKVKVNWFVNGVKLEDALKKDDRLDSKRFQSTKDGLTFTDLRVTDSMVIQCNVTNNNGHIYAEAFLNVLAEKPSILDKPETTKVAEGESFVLACKITGKPDPIITWYKDDLQITGGRYVVTEEGSLTVTTAVLSDAGEYLCHAENIHGEVAAGATVIVRRKTVIEMEPLDLEVQTGTNAKFTCSGTTDPEEIESLTTSWMKDGKPVELGTRMFVNYQDHSLTISGTEGRDTGTYQCVVSNGLDDDRKSARLVVTDYPFESTRVEVINSCNADKEAELEWMPGAFNNAPIQYFIVEYQTSRDPDHWVYAVQVNYTKAKAYIPLSPGLDYTFRVTSFNKIGASPPSEPSTKRCVTKSAPPSQNPRNVRTVGDIPHKLHIEWTPVPPEHQGGEGFFYTLKIRQVGNPASTTLAYKIKDWEQYEFITDSQGESYSPYIIGISCENNAGNSTDSAPSIIGHTGEGLPTISPYNLQVLDFDAEYVTLQWDFDRSEIGKPITKIKGEFRGFKVQVWEKNRRAASIIDIDLPPEQFKKGTAEDTFTARVRHLKPNMVLEARVALLNNFYVSAPSEIVDFVSLPGLPGPVSYLEDLNVGDNHVNLEWRPSLDNRGDIVGYDIGYQQVEGLHLGQLQERIPQVDDAFASNAVLGGLKPDTKYRIFVWARTAAGRGEPYFIERRTAKPGVPLIPRFTISRVGRDFINVTWWKDAFQESGNIVLVEYKKENGREWLTSNPEVSQNWVSLHFLQPGITYSVRVVVTNGDDIRRLSETQEVTTDGGAKGYDIGENLPWFLAMIFSVLLQFGLLIFFIVCYRRGFRFKSVEGNVQTYQDQGETYSDKSPIPRISEDFQDPLGYNNDYYGDKEGYDEDERDDYDDRDHPYGDDYDDDDDEGGFREPARRVERGVHSVNQGLPPEYEDDYPPYNDDGSEDFGSEGADEPRRRRAPRENNEYEDYDMDPVDTDRRYPADPHRSSPHDSWRSDSREPGLQTESYRSDRPRDYPDDSSTGLRAERYRTDASEDDRQPGLRTEGYRTDRPRYDDDRAPGLRAESYRADRPIYGDDRAPGLRAESYRTDRPRDMRRDDEDHHDDDTSRDRGRGYNRPQSDRDLVDELRERQRDRRYPAHSDSGSNDYSATMI